MFLDGDFRAVSSYILKDVLNEVLQRKYDIKGIRDVLTKMQDGRIRPHVVSMAKYSVLSSKIVDDAIDRGVEGPEKTVEKLKEGLNVRHIRVVCLT